MQRDRGLVGVEPPAYALLLEAAARLYAGALSTQLGVDPKGPFGRQLGDELTRYLRSSPPAPGRPPGGV